MKLFDSILKSALDRISVLDLVDRAEAQKTIRNAVVKAAHEGAKTFLAEVDSGKWGVLDGLVTSAVKAGHEVLEAWRMKALAA